MTANAPVTGTPIGVDEHAEDRTVAGEQQINVTNGVVGGVGAAH